MNGHYKEHHKVPPICQDCPFKGWADADGFCDMWTKTLYYCIKGKFMPTKKNKCKLNPELKGEKG